MRQQSLFALIAAKANLAMPNEAGALMRPFRRDARAGTQRWIAAPGRSGRDGHRWRARVVLVVCVMVLALGSAYPARACTIDGVASLTLNGYYATKTRTLPTARSLTYWASFSLGDLWPQTAATLSEDLAKLRGTLPVEAFKQPFDWRFGDGGSARGMSVVHGYRYPGLYRIEVRYYWSPARRWVLFDSAQLHVVRVVALSPAHSGSLWDQHVSTISVAGLISLVSVAIIAHMVSLSRRRFPGNSEQA